MFVEFNLQNHTENLKKIFSYQLDLYDINAKF